MRLSRCRQGHSLLFADFAAKIGAVPVNGDVSTGNRTSRGNLPIAGAFRPPGRADSTRASPAAATSWPLGGSPDRWIASWRKAAAARAPPRLVLKPSTLRRRG